MVNMVNDYRILQSRKLPKHPVLHLTDDFSAVYESWSNEALTMSSNGYELALLDAKGT